MHHFEKQIQIWSHFFGESGYKTERLHITSHEVYHEGLLEAELGVLFLKISIMNYVFHAHKLVKKIVSPS